jgi:hypothetical protein
MLTMSDDDHPVAVLIAAGVFVLVSAFVYKFLKSIASHKPEHIISTYEAQELARYAQALVKESAARKSSPAGTKTGNRNPQNHYAPGNSEKVENGMKTQRRPNTL